MKILILEDDTNLSETLIELLNKKNRLIKTFIDSDEACDDISINIYDLYILDINVQGSMSGYEVAEYVKEVNKDAVILIISAITDYESVEKVFNIGCNDYIKKPFDIRELNLKIDSLMKFFNKNKNLVNLGNGYEYDVSKESLLYYEKVVDLTKKEALFLKILLKNENVVVENETIMDYVWGKYVKPTTFRSVVFKLSKKLSAGILINIKGCGYKIITS